MSTIRDFRVCARPGQWACGVGLLLLAGCTTAADPPQRRGPDAVPAAPAVTTAKPVRKTLSHRIEQPGEVRAYAQAPLFVRISGYVAKVHKDIGDSVNEGDVLAELSVPEMDEELNLKQAEVAVAQARIEQAKKLLAVAEADHQSAGARLKEAEASRPRAAAELKRAESQLARFQKSAAVLTGENVDEVRLTVEATKAAVAEVESRIGSARAARVAAEARRDKAEADVTLAQANHKSAAADERQKAAQLQYARLRAPFAGIVTWRKVDPGWLLQPDAGAKAEPVFIVASIDPVRVVVDVPERAAALVKNGAPAVVRVQALASTAFTGTVTRTAWSLDPAQRTLRTEIDLKNPDGMLRPGMYVTSVITAEHANVWTVPVSALVVAGDRTFCYVIAGDKAVRTPIRIGFRDGESVEVMQKQPSGPQARWADFSGDEAIVVNAAAVSDGQIVPTSQARYPGGGEK